MHLTAHLEDRLVETQSGLNTNNEQVERIGQSSIDLSPAALDELLKYFARPEKADCGGQHDQPDLVLSCHAEMHC